jgi:N-carbamoyl-L-amino-acid hydrolase
LVLAHAGIPSAMIFIRNENGSHNPREDMKMADFMSGVAVMRKVLAEAAL